MKKEVRYNGQTAALSDYDAPDGDLAASLGIIKHRGALRPIPAPKEVCPPQELVNQSSLNVVHIHKTSKFTHKIIFGASGGGASGGTLYWADGLEAEKQDFHELQHVSSDPVVTSIGNTLVLMLNNGIVYYLWEEDEGTYLSLGTLPEVAISFGLQSELGMSEWHQFEVTEAIPSADLQRSEGQPVDLSDANRTVFTSAIIAEVNKFIAEKGNGAGKFIMPFFVRYALRLYDGTLIHHSAPVFMPCASDVTPAAVVSYGGGTSGDFLVQVMAPVHTLDYKAQSIWSDLDKWKDIITSIDIFVSAPIYKYDQSGSVKQIGPAPRGTWSLSKQTDQESATYPLHYQVNSLARMYYLKTGQGLDNIALWKTWAVLPSKSDEEFASSIRSCSNFYLLKSIPLDRLSHDRVALDIPADYLQSLVTREVMTDDYDSHDMLIAGTSFVYNQRLNLANLKKSIFSGFDAFSALPFSDGFIYNPEYDRNYDRDDRTYDVSFYVYLKKNGKTFIVQSYNSPMAIAFGVPLLYFYYPSTDAYKVIVKRGSSYWEFPLTPHDLLNGAVYVGGFSDGWPAGDALPEGPSADDDVTVEIPNKLYTSEVGNPFVFPLLGISTVGTGRIIGLSTAAKALSEGQFGQFPLYVFSDEGVWALEVSPTGTFSAKQPITRDVALGPECITQLDNAVLFATERGIMVLSGSNSACISEMIDDDGSPFDIQSMPEWQDILSLAGYGADPGNAAEPQEGETPAVLDIVPFKVFIQGCSIIYSYIRQQVFVFNPQYDYAYVYSMEDKAWGMVPSDLALRVDSYPRALASTKDAALVDYAGEGDAFPQLVVTRPMALEFPDILKTVRRTIQRGHFSKSHVACVLIGSRDLENWSIVRTSSNYRMENFGGTPYKYYRLVLIGSLGKEESISSATFDVEPRLTDRIR